MTQLRAGEYEADLNGIRIHYWVQGSGPALLAHSGGPGMDARLWGDFAKIGDFVTVVAIHPRGSGLSGYPPDGAYRLEDYAADLEALRQHLGLEQPIVMGWSHGGFVAQLFACRYPASLSKLVLLDTSAYFGEFLQDIEGAVSRFKDQPWYQESFTALKKEWEGDYQTEEDMRRLWEHEMKFYFKEFDEKARQYHQRTKDLPLRIDSLRFFNEQEAGSLDLRPCLKEVTVPALVMTGRYDFITTVEMAEEIAANLPNARLKIFENSGHFAMVEEPEAFYQEVKEFVGA